MVRNTEDTEDTGRVACFRKLTTNLNQDRLLHAGPAWTVSNEQARQGSSQAWLLKSATMYPWKRTSYRYLHLLTGRFGWWGREFRRVLTLDQIKEQESQTKRDTGFDD